MRSMTPLLVPLCAALLLVGCNDDDDDPVVADPTSVYDVAVSDGRFTTLVAAIEAADLVDDLENPDGTFTVFAPTDAAFTDLLSALDITAAELLADPDLAAILTYHVLTSEVNAAAALTQDGASVSTLQGDSIIVDDLAGTVLINDATVTQADVMGDNGIVHVIDKVLLPPEDLLSTLETRGYSTLKLALETATPTLPAAPNTILVPTNAAFDTFISANGYADAAALLADADLGSILANHVVNDRAPASTVAGLSEVTTAAGETYSVSVSGATITLGGAVTVSAANIPFDGGVIHVVDTVVPAPDTDTIYDIVSADPTFSTLKAAIDTADLAATLDAQVGTYTVFAPNDTAFTALLADLGLTASELLANPDLATVLLYHVLATEVDAAGALGVDGAEVATAATTPVIVDDLDGMVFVNDAKVIAADIEAKNGIIHGIDKVLWPTSDLLSTLEFLGLTTLKAALEEAEPALPAAPNTILAPTNAAFETFIADNAYADAAALLADPDLGTILANHVVAVRAPASTVAGLTEVTTAAGETYSISASGTTITIGGAITVSTFNLPFSGGVIHIIDTVVPAPAAPLEDS